MLCKALNLADEQLEMNNFLLKLCLIVINILAFD
jgi:hypothetical protein